MKRDNLVERSLKELDFSLPEQHAEGTHDENQDWSEIESDIRGLEQKIPRCTYQFLSKHNNHIDFFHSLICSIAMDKTLVTWLSFIR